MRVTRVERCQERVLGGLGLTQPRARHGRGRWAGRGHRLPGMWHIKHGTALPSSRALTFCSAILHCFFFSRVSAS